MGRDLRLLTDATLFDGIPSSGAAFFSESIEDILRPTRSVPITKAIRSVPESLSELGNV